MNAFTSFLSMDLGKLTQGSLAVIGATVVGAIFSGLMLNLVAKALWAKSSPPAALKLTRGAGGLTSGFLASMYLFGGSGGWGDGGAGPGTGGETKPKAADVTPAVGTVVGPLRIAMLGGERVKNAAFYQLEGEKEPRTLESLTAFLDEKAKSKQAPSELAIQLLPDSVARDHAAVKDLEEWAAKHGLIVHLNIIKAAP